MRKKKRGKKLIRMLHCRTQYILFSLVGVSCVKRRCRKFPGTSIDCVSFTPKDENKALLTVFSLASSNACFESAAVFAGELNPGRI